LPWTDLPPAQGSSLQYYPRLIQVWDAIRERQAVGGTTTAWPRSSFNWYDGTLTSVIDNGDGTISLYDSTASSAFSGAGWVDSLGNKRWTSCAQFDLNNNGSIAASESGSGATAFFEPDGSAPPNYRVVIYPPDTPNASHLGDPNLGFVYRIQDNGDDFLKITDDGRLALNGKKLTEYVGFRYQIIRYESGGTQQGHGFPQRYPPKPNDTEYDYGTITASTTTTITDASESGWHAPKDFDGTFLKDKDILFKVGAKWRRGRIAAALGNQIKFSVVGGPLAAPPTVGGGYWIVDKNAWWRPEFRLELEQVTTYSGQEWVRSPGVAAGPGPWSDSGSNFRPWEPLGTWYSGYTDQSSITHSPADDSLTGILKFVEQVDVELGEAPPSVVTPVTVFDVDAVTSPTDLFNPDHLFNPWLYWSLRGLDVGIDLDAFGAAVWVARKGYSGDAAIPELTTATWQEIYIPANTRRSAIDVVVVTEEVSIGINPETFIEEFETVEVDRYCSIAIAMPIETPQAGAYDELDCDWTILDTDGSIKHSGTGTTSATELRSATFTFDEADDGLTVVIAFGRTRKYERRVRRLYPRSYFVPDVGFDTDDLVVPPTEEFPGDYDTIDRSGTYAEYSELGELQDVGPAFVVNEAYRYTGDDYFHPFPGGIVEGEINEFLDAGYQGRPAPEEVSDFPRWTKVGIITAGGSFWFEDSTACWWVDPAPMVTHEGTGTAGSTASILKDANQYKLWPTEITNPSPPPDSIFEDQLRLSRYWSSGDRFLKMILEVAVSGSGTSGDPYVWERRPIVAMNVTGADETNPYLTVSPAFSSTMLNRPYKIREPGFANNRVILNTWRGRQVTVRRAEDGEESTVEVSYSDDNRAYFADGALGFTPVPGDTYEFIQRDPGEVVHYRPTSPTAFNGFVGPADAVQDTRGTNWLTEGIAGVAAERRNSPTIVNAYGWFQKGDIPLKHYWDERVAALNALVWTKIAAGYTNNGEDNSNFGLALSGDGGTYNTLKTFVENEYDSDTNLGTSTDPPEAGAKGSSTSDVAGGDSAFVTTIYQYMTATAPTTELASKIGWYVYATTHDDEAPVDNPPVQVVAFDSFGANIQYHAWDEYEEGSPSTAATRTSGKIGSDTRPPLPSLAVPSMSGVTYVDRRGYQITDKFAIAKWNVTGGLTYVDSHD
jgi:hypothetical protein